ncbi:MAG: hypothetical protein ABI679_08500 [Gemmatimonadota bacterium]
MTLRAGCLALLSLSSAMVATGHAQQYRLRLDSRFQSVSFRGVALDSVPAAATVLVGGSRQTADGFAVSCLTGDTFCFFFRPGAIQTARPSVTSVAGTLWGLGVPGLSVRGDARVAMDLGDAEVLPGTNPAVQLLEGYVEYATDRWTGRLGRQVYTSRLGFTGFDGARFTARMVNRQVEVDGYLGWGLARGSALPVTSAALNPLDDFQPHQRQLVAGLGAGWNHRFGDLRLEYQREVDPQSSYFVSDRAAAATSIRLSSRLSLNAGAEYDLAMARWGTTDATLRFFQRTWSATAGFTRYRPHFELWTIWGAFSPVGYSAVNGSVSVSPVAGLSVRARGSRFWFEDTETDTPLVTVEDRGWRVNVGATYSPSESFSFNLDHDTEFGPGASSASIDGGVTYLPARDLSLTLHAGRLRRPLEFRFNDATLRMFGLDADWRFSDRWRASASASRFMEKRDRPDASAFDWNQTRLSVQLSVMLGSDAGHQSLPPAVRSTDRPAK